MIKYKYILLLGLVIVSCARDKKVEQIKCDNYFAYDVVDRIIKPFCLPDSIKVNYLGNEGVLIIKDCRGNADLIVYDSLNNIVVRGFFIESDVYREEKEEGKVFSVNVPYMSDCWSYNQFIPNISKMKYDKWVNENRDGLLLEAYRKDSINEIIMDSLFQLEIDSITKIEEKGKNSQKKVNFEELGGDYEIIEVPDEGW